METTKEYTFVKLNQKIERDKDVYSSEYNNKDIYGVYLIDGTKFTLGRCIGSEENRFVKNAITSDYIFKNDDDQDDLVNFVSFNKKKIP